MIKDGDQLFTAKAVQDLLRQACTQLVAKAGRTAFGDVEINLSAPAGEVFFYKADASPAPNAQQPIVINLTLKPELKLPHRLRRTKVFRDRDGRMTETETSEQDAE